VTVDPTVAEAGLITVMAGEVTVKNIELKPDAEIMWVPEVAGITTVPVLVVMVGHVCCAPLPVKVREPESNSRDGTALPKYVIVMVEPDAAVVDEAVMKFPERKVRRTVWVLVPSLTIMLYVPADGEVAGADTAVGSVIGRDTAPLASVVKPVNDPPALVHTAGTSP